MKIIYSFIQKCKIRLVPHFSFVAYTFSKSLYCLQKADDVVSLICPDDWCYRDEMMITAACPALWRRRGDTHSLHGQVVPRYHHPASHQSNKPHTHNYNSTISSLGEINRQKAFCSPSSIQAGCGTTLVQEGEHCRKKWDQWIDCYSIPTLFN